MSSNNSRQSHLVTRRGLTKPQLCHALLLQGCLPKGNPAWSKYTVPTPSCPNTLHTLLLSKGIGVGGGAHNKLLFHPTSEGF